MTDMASTKGEHLQGLKIVLTGDFAAHERDAATRLLTACGASVTSAVSGKTSVVIAGTNPGATKLGEAHKRSLPVLGEPELLALLSGKTLAQVLARDGAAARAAGDAPAGDHAPVDKASVASKASPDPVSPGADKALPLPLPDIACPPRDGEHVERFPGTDKVRCRGAYVNGLKQGSWKTWDEGGQLREDCSWDKGLKEGPELAWFASGQRCCVGQNHSGKRVGSWQWFYESGSPDHSYVYDDQGRKHGPHIWDLPSGDKRARGQFVEDKFHGHWSWWHEKDPFHIERGYHHGLQHGKEEGFFADGAPAYRRAWRYGQKDGLEEVFQRKDSEVVLCFRGEWRCGFPIGAHESWDAAGQKTVTHHESGLPESVVTANLGDKVAKLLKKATSSYAKADALGEGVAYSQRAPHLLHLWRTGHVDAAADPELWELLSQAAPLMTGQDVVKLLGAIMKKEIGHGSFLEYWPDYLDRLVMEVYSRDPAPIDAAAAKLPARLRKGVSLVQARFGRPTSAPLGPELGELAKKHVLHFGLGQRIYWPDAEGRSAEQVLFNDYRYEPTPLSAEFLALFGPADAWRAALAAQAKEKMKEGRLALHLIRPVLEHATPEEMSRYLDAASLDNDTQEQIRRALTEWRQDDADTLAKIALAMKEGGLRRWPAVSVALLAFAQQGRPAPAALVDALPLDCESPTYTSSWYTDPLQGLADEGKANPALVLSRIPIVPGCAVPRMRLLRQALATLPKDVLEQKLASKLAEQYGKTSAFQYLYLVRSPALWDRAFAVADAESYGHADMSVYGLGDLGEEAIARLVALAKKVKGKEWKDGIAKAMLVALARTLAEGGSFSPALDKYLSFSAVPKDYDYQFYQIFLHSIVHRLPVERAEAVLLAGLSGKHFSRAFRMIGSHPTPRVLRAALSELLAREATFKSEDQRAVGLGLASLPEPRAWVKWILKAGGGGGMRDALREAIGHQGLEAVEKELASEGVQKAVEIDAVEKVRRRAAEGGGGAERIYLFRKLNAQGHGEDLNRIGGAAPGVDAARWPAKDGEPMTHLFTMDLTSMPELRRLVACDDGGVPRAVSVFCASPDMNGAYEPYSGETAVVVSSEAQLAAGGAPPEAGDLMAPQRFEVVAANVPPTVWRSRSGDLRDEIYRLSGRALGEPLWLQSPQHHGALLCQFDEGFVSMNLGDTGIMYVFADTAFWQCH